MFNAGICQIDHQHIRKGELAIRMLVVMVGGVISNEIGSLNSIVNIHDQGVGGNNNSFILLVF